MGERRGSGERARRIAVFGASAGPAATLSVPALYFGQVSISGTTLGSPEDFRAMLEFVAAHGKASLSDRTPYNPRHDRLLAR